MSPTLPALYGAATLLLNSTIWIFGGNTSDSSTNAIISIDVSKSWPISSPLINSFPSNADTPGWLSPRSFSSMVLGADGSSLWIYGGRSDSSDLTDDQFSVFDTKSKAWSDPQKQKVLNNNNNLLPVFAQSAVRDTKGIAYYYGGGVDLSDTDLSSFDDGPGLLKLNTSTSTFSSSQASANPGPLAWHTATLVNNTLMYVIGGLKPNSFDDLNVTVYNTVTDKWSPPINYTVRPSGRHGHSAVLSADNSQIIVFGGVSSNKYLNDIWTLDLAANKWTFRNASGNAPSGRAYHNSALVNNQMIVMFGYSQKASNTVYILDTTTWTWTTSFDPNPAQTTTSSNNNNDTSGISPDDISYQKIPISIAGIAGIVLAAVAVASVVMLSVVQPKNRVKPI
jgi:hypothetical protein